MHIVFFLLAAAFVMNHFFSEPEDNLWLTEIEYRGSTIEFSAMKWVYAPIVAVWGLYLLGYWVGGLAYTLGV